MMKTLSAFFMALGLAGFMSACDNQTPTQSVSESIGQSVEHVQENIGQAAGQATENVETAVTEAAATTGTAETTQETR